MGCFCSTDQNDNINDKDTLINNENDIMKERKNKLFETALILGQELKDFEDIKMCKLLDMSMDDEKEYVRYRNNFCTITHSAMATMEQMFPPDFSILLRNNETKHPLMPNEHLPHHSLFRRASVVTMDKNSLVIYWKHDYYTYGSFETSCSESIKYFIPCANYRPLSFQVLNDMTFRTSHFLTLNGLNFYPTSTISKEIGKEIVRFKSDGLIIDSRDNKLIEQLEEALVKNEQAADELYQNEEAELTEGGVLFGERRILEKQLKIEMARKVDKKVYLTLDIPVGWSCVTDCYWVNLSIINQS